MIAQLSDRQGEIMLHLGLANNQNIMTIIHPTELVLILMFHALVLVHCNGCSTANPNLKRLGHDQSREFVRILRDKS